jgi:hypothetical protein
MIRQSVWTSVRATPREVAAAMPGDALVTQPIGVVTHAVTIDAPPEEVWPWLAQMGAGTRAGWYSYDRLDNSGKRSAWRILARLQEVAVGDLFPALPGARDAFVVVACEPAKALVLAVPASDDGYRAHWAFALVRSGRDQTRLIVRASFAYTLLHLPRSVMRVLARIVHFIMERKQLLGIKQRVEYGRLWLALADSGHALDES